MSSKRKNTPTKLPKEDVVKNHSALGLDDAPCSPGNSDTEVDNEEADIHSDHSNDNFHDDRVDDDTESGSESEAADLKLSSLLNSPTKSSSLSSTSILGSSGLFNSQKRSMENVLRRLNSKASDATVDTPLTSESPKVMDTVQAVLAGEATLSEKERQISEMINHLQNIRENLSKQKDQVCYCSLY
ncbi:unnamed protein product [Lymnaea stagnalis]|uniref:Uncharacterized protein n=1 Tax=Lymnaea stagnalis TaxID=6523 RepID=A0AAV2IP89_LYMST